MDKTSQIAHLLFRIHCGETLPDDEQEFLSVWVSESDSHPDMYSALLNEDQLFEDFREFSSLDITPSWDRIVNTINPLTHRIRWRRYLIAATLLGTLATSIWLWSHRHTSGPGKNSAQQALNDIAPGRNKAVLTLANGAIVVLDSISNGMVAHQGGVLVSKTDSGRLSYKALDLAHNETLFNTLTTPKAGQFQLTLPDGTRVWLNNASSLRYPVLFPGDSREVELSGEAYFEVANDPSRPFKVKVNQMTIEVLGTSFNISAYSDETTIKTTLLSGSIRVSHPGQSLNLHPGEQAQLTNGTELTIKRDVDLDAVVSWKDGFFAFDKADIHTVMRQLARWYDLDVKYEGQVPNQLFQGFIERDLSLSQVLDILKKNQCHFKVEGRIVTIFP